MRKMRRIQRGGLGMRKMRRTRAERRMIRIYETLRRSINIGKDKVDD
jgi:hypothetical protein